MLYGIHYLGYLWGTSADVLQVVTVDFVLHLQLFITKTKKQGLRTHLKCVGGQYANYLRCKLITR